MADVDTTEAPMNGEDAIRGEIVARDPQEDRGERERSAIEAASDAALAMPGVPGRDEFLSLAMQARVLSLSGAAPEAIRNNPHVAFHVAMVGRDLGISPSAAIELIDVIKTKNGYQLSLSPQLLSGQIRRLGLGEIVFSERSDHKAVAVAVGPGGTDRRCRRTGALQHVDDCACDILGATEFTWEDARVAGLVMPGCEPGNHTAKCRNYNSKAYERCNQGYVTYPKRMMGWRAAGFCADDYFPEAGLGLYSPEELGAVVDNQGRPIDPANVALPPGYTDPQEERRQRQLNAGPKPADPDDLAALRDRIKALPEPAVAALKERWAQPRSADAGGGPMLPVDQEGRPATGLLDERSIKTARALVQSFEREVEAGKHGTPATDPAPTPDGQPGPEAPAEPRQGIKPSQRQMARLHALLNDKRNATEPDDRHTVLSELAGRAIGSASELSTSEVAQAIETLAAEEDWGEPV